MKYVLWILSLCCFGVDCWWMEGNLPLTWIGVLCFIGIATFAGWIFWLGCIAAFNSAVNSGRDWDRK